MGPAASWGQDLSGTWVDAIVLNKSVRDLAVGVVFWNNQEMGSVTV